MQFLVLGYDGTDEQAGARRQAARPQHLAVIDKLQSSGNMLYAVAICDPAGKVCGSAVVVEYPDRAGLEGWLADEPYVLGKVWEKIEVSECKVAPAFLTK